MKPLSLKEKQFAYLDILKELDRYCQDNNLIYYLGCGTLIGAVRHGGFIPWDDDLDVFMPRPDFKKICQSYSSSSYNFRSIYNDKSHPYNFGRFCSNSLFRLFKNKPVFNVGIDVYVINGAPSTEEEQNKLIYDTSIHLKRADLLNRFRNGLIRRNLWPSNSMNFTLLNKELFRAELCFERYNYDNCDFIWPYGGGRLIMKKELYGKPIRIPFENGMFLAPEHYKEVLTLGYGDYMKIPPIEKRVPYHSCVIYRK